jgi:hypothetical protein
VKTLKGAAMTAFRLSHQQSDFIRSRSGWVLHGANFALGQARVNDVFCGPRHSARHGQHTIPRLAKVFNSVTKQLPMLVKTAALRMLLPADL